MIVVHENVSAYIPTKPMECPKCGYKRAFDVPVAACVRLSRRGRPPPEELADIALLKCKKCGHTVGITVEQGKSIN